MYLTKSPLFRVGRRPVYGGCHLMTGVAAILAAFIPEYFPQMIKVCYFFYVFSLSTEATRSDV